MTTKEFEGKLKEGNFKVKSKVTIYRKTSKGWSDSVDVSSYVQSYNISSERSFGADQINIDFINAYDLFWANKNSPYNKVIESKSEEISVGTPSTMDLMQGNSQSKPITSGYVVQRGTSYPPEGYAIYTVNKLSEQRWDYLQLDVQHTGSLYSHAKLDLIFGATEEELTSSTNRINNFLYSTYLGATKTKSKIPVGFDQYNCCQIVVKLDVPNNRYSEVVLQDVKMRVWGVAQSEKYLPLVYWGNRVKIEEETFLSDGTQAEFTRFYGKITEVPTDFSPVDRGNMQITALDMMSVLNSEIYERPRRNRESVYKDDKLIQDTGILEPRLIKNEADVILNKLKTDNTIIPIEDTDVGYVYSVPVEFRYNPTCTNLGDSIIEDTLESSQLITSGSSRESPQIIYGQGSRTIYSSPWWQTGTIKISKPEPYYMVTKGDNNHSRIEPSWTIKIGTAEYNENNFPSSLPYQSSYIISYEVHDLPEWAFLMGGESIQITVSGGTPPVQVEPTVDDVVFNVTIPSGATSVKLKLRNTGMGVSGYTTSIGGTLSITDGMLFFGREKTFRLYGDDGGKNLTITIKDMSLRDSSTNGYLNIYLDYEFTVDSDAEGNGDRKYINWAKSPQPVIKAKHSAETFMKTFTEADGIQIDYARGIVYMPEKFDHPKDTVTADFYWYDMDTNRFEEVVSEIIKDAFLQVEGYNPNDWILVDEKGQETTLEKEYSTKEIDGETPKRLVPLMWIYTKDGKRTNLKIELGKSYPRSTIPRTIYTIQDKKTHYQCIQELLEQRYVDPSYRIWVDTRTILGENGEEDTEIVFKGDYKYQYSSEDAEVVLYKTISYPLDNKDLYTKVIAIGEKPTSPNVAITATKVEFYNFLEGLKGATQYGTSKSNTKVIVDGDINSPKNYYGYYTKSPDYHKHLPADACKIDLKDPIELGRIDILWGRNGSGENSSDFGARIKVSENGTDWYALKEDGSGVRGSSGEWSTINEGEFDPLIKILMVRYIMIEATHLAEYTPTGLSGGVAYCWSIREVQIFPSDEIRVESTIFDISAPNADLKSSIISTDTAEKLQTLVGERTYVLPLTVNLMSEDMARARAKDVLFEMCRLMQRAELECIYLPHIKVGMTVRLNDERANINKLYLVESVNSKMSKSIPSCSLSLVSWE